MFTIDGIYDDYIYGEFKEEKYRYDAPDHFPRDAKISPGKCMTFYNDSKGYVRYASRSPQRQAGSENRKVAVPGMAYFQFNDSLIEYYGR